MWRVGGISIALILLLALTIPSVVVGEGGFGMAVNAQPSTRSGQSEPVFLRGDPAARPEEQVDLRPEIRRRGIKVRDQGNRPTCSVHAMTFLLEWLYTGMCGRRWNDLSEEYLNHVANLATGRTDDGDFFESIHQGFLKYGAVRERALPYDKDRAYDFDATSIPSSLIEDGRRFLKDTPAVRGRFIKEWSKTNPGLSEAQLTEMLDCLRQHIPVAIGRDHSMVAVGFELDQAQPGGGLFILRDSRGKGSGDRGYLTESFQSVKTTAFDVFVYEKE